MQTEQNLEIGPAAAVTEANDGELFSPEDWALHDEIQQPALRPLSPPERELTSEDEDAIRDT